MAYGQESNYGSAVIEAGESERARFLRNTYLHLFGAILVFIGLEAILLGIPGLATSMISFVVGVGGRWGLLIYMLGFMAASSIARSWAHNAASPGAQYLGLGLYTLAEAIFFAPMLWYAQMIGPDVIPTSAIITLVTFGGLTTIVLLTGADFSFLRIILSLSTVVALVACVCGIIFGFNLGLFFSVAMVVVACGFILYDTSNVLHHYRPDQHVGAALELFASVALLFWYVLRIVIALQSRD